MKDPLELLTDVLGEHNEALQAISKQLDTILENQDVLARNLNVIYERLKVVTQSKPEDGEETN